jgi:adenylylsulfate kinase-like enzyme
MIIDPVRGSEADVTEAWGTHSQVSERERESRLGQSGTVVWITAASPSDATTLAYAIERRLFDEGRVAAVAAESDGFGGSGAHAPERAAELARRLSNAGLIAVFALAAPTRADRDVIRSAQRSGELFEVYALRGSQGPSDGFEPPLDPAVTIDLDATEIEGAARLVVEALSKARRFDAG